MYRHISFGSRPEQEDKSGYRLTQSQAQETVGWYLRWTGSGQGMRAVLDVRGGNPSRLETAHDGAASWPRVLTIDCLDTYCFRSADGSVGRTDEARLGDVDQEEEESLGRRMIHLMLVVG